MAKKSSIAKQKKREGLVLKYKEKHEKLLKEFKSASSYEEKLELQFKLQKIPLNASKIRLRNRCWHTGRPRGVYRDFGLSRNMIRLMGHQGLLPGLTKSSW